MKGQNLGTSTGLRKFLAKSVLSLLENGGTKVDESVYIERLEICKGCDFSGTVEPLPFMKFEGCTKCGCPFETKLMFDTLPFEGELSATNVIKGGSQKVKCPINKW